MATGRTPVAFIHGLWFHATSRAPCIELFGDAGYEPITPRWPGDPDTVEAARANSLATDRRRHHNAGTGIPLNA